MSSPRVTVESAFGRWRCLLKRLENVTTVAITCCVLHDICQMRKNECIDKDGMLDEILRKKRARRRNRRQEHDAHRAAEFVRSSLKDCQFLVQMKTKNFVGIETEKAF